MATKELRLQAIQAMKDHIDVAYQSLMTTDVVRDEAKVQFAKKFLKQLKAKARGTKVEIV